jgi:predicted amidophosphoribosyltransferase
LREKNTHGPVTLIPVPNSSCALTNTIVSRTLSQAQALANNLNHTTVLDCLRWKQPQASASSGGGTRHPQLLYGNLALTAQVPSSNLILVDDVSTSGGHLQAARAILQSQKGKCDLAICAARTVWDQSEEPFSTSEQQIPDWSPNASLFRAT